VVSNSFEHFRVSAETSAVPCEFRSTVRACIRFRIVPYNDERDLKTRVILVAKAADFQKGRAAGKRRRSSARGIAELEFSARSFVTPFKETATDGDIRIQLSCSSDCVVAKGERPLGRLATGSAPQRRPRRAARWRYACRGSWLRSTATAPLAERAGISIEAPLRKLRYLIPDEFDGFGEYQAHEPSFSRFVM
jgi:hypothetical protein